MIELDCWDEFISLFLEDEEDFELLLLFDFYYHFRKQQTLHVNHGNIINSFNHYNNSIFNILSYEYKFTAFVPIKKFFF